MKFRVRRAFDSFAKGDVIEDTRDISPAFLRRHCVRIEADTPTPAAARPAAQLTASVEEK